MNLHFLSFDLITVHLSDWRVMGNSSRDVPDIIGNKMWGLLQYYHPLQRLLVSVTRQIAAVVTHGNQTHVRWQRGADERAAMKGVNARGYRRVVLVQFPQGSRGPFTPKMCMHIEISISLVIRSQPVTVKLNVELQEIKKHTIKGSH